MSNRNHDKLHGLIGPGKIIVDGSFVPLTGAGTVDATKVTGLGFGYAPVKGVMALITGTSTANTAPTITIVILNGATPTDAAASQRVHFHAVFRDSTTRYQKP